ncbi:hypothetical protein D3C87_280220 [compost metagenome]
MYFNPHYIEALIAEPLRYFFSTYTQGSKFVWDKDEKKRTVDIDYKNNINKLTHNERPRILIERGTYQINKTGLTDNLAEAKSVYETKGVEDRTNMVFYNGTASLIIEARQKGSCEILADMATHFIVWSRPFICSSQGFKEFGLPMTVGECELEGSSEDAVQKYRVQVQLPYMKEEHWKVNTESVKIKNFFLQFSPGNDTI